jgi:hypothetical protein
MKKLLKSFFVLATLAVLTFQISGCKKDCPVPTTTYTVQGLWIGTYSANGLSGASFYSFIVYPDGTLVTRSKGFDGNYYYTSGSWTLSGTDFTATVVSFVTPGVNPVTQSIKTTYSNTGVMTNGIWKDVINTNGTPLTGTFSDMKRVN